MLKQTNKQTSQIYIQIIAISIFTVFPCKQIILLCRQLLHTQVYKYNNNIHIYSFPCKQIIFLCRQLPHTRVLTRFWLILDQAWGLSQFSPLSSDAVESGQGFFFNFQNSNVKNFVELINYLDILFNYIIKDFFCHNLPKITFCFLLSFFVFSSLCFPTN